MKPKASKSRPAGKPPPLIAERRKPKRRHRSHPSDFRWRRYLGYTAIFFLIVSALPMLLLRWVDPPTSSFMLQVRSELSGNTPLHYEWVDWEAISSQLQIAVVAAEDQRFPEHFGFDLKSIERALQDRQAGRSTRGASTISQQVVKNLFLWPGQSWLRKGVEAWLTSMLELAVPKQRILEIYLNIAQWGDRQFGAQAASEYYFAKNASDLNRWEAALMAAVLPNPTIYRIDHPSRHVHNRQRWILRQIRGLGGPAYLSTL